MRRLSLFLVFLLTGSFALAQTPSDPPPVLKNVPNFTNGRLYGNSSKLPSNFGCPVGFAASRQATGRIMSADETRRSGPAQGLHLTLNNRGTPAIESIEVTVYGTSQKGLLLPVDTPYTDTISKTFQLHRTPGDTSLSDADVWMHLVGSLSWADLISITYADGATWRATEHLKCRAVASNFMLVGRK